MSNKKTYIIDWDWKIELVIEVDHNIVTNEELHSINSFFCEHQYRLSEEKGNVLHAVLKLLAQKCFLLAVWYDYTTEGMISLFDPDDICGDGGQEGWPKMDGSMGMKILRCDVLDFDADDMSIKEEPSI